MNLTRIFTFVGLLVVMMAMAAAMERQFWLSISLLGFLVVAGVALALRNFWHR
jgi:uncharacterized membrane protein